MYEQSHRDCSPALVICIIVCLSWAVNRDNASHRCAQRDKNARATEAGERAIIDTSVMLLRSMQNTRRELADAKAENDALRDDVAAGRRRLSAVCQSVREATVASGAG